MSTAQSKNGRFLDDKGIDCDIDLTNLLEKHRLGQCTNFVIVASSRDCHNGMNDIPVGDSVIFAICRERSLACIFGVCLEVHPGPGMIPNELVLARLIYIRARA